MLALQQRHEPLRTASRGEQGKVLQPIESVAVLPWQETDLDALALAQRLEKARRQAAQAAQPPLALQRAAVAPGRRRLGSRTCEIRFGAVMG